MVNLSKESCLKTCGTFLALIGSFLPGCNKQEGNNTYQTNNPTPVVKIKPPNDPESNFNINSLSDLKLPKSPQPADVCIPEENKASVSPSITSVEDLKNAVAHVYVNNRNSSGSGFIINVNNIFYLVTCKHVLGNNQNNIEIVLENGRQLNLKQIFLSDKSDLALIQLIDTNLQALKFAKKDPQIFDKLITVGFPKDYEETITKGHVLFVTDKDFIEPNVHDCKVINSCLINPGNSGGVVLTQYGEEFAIIGVTMGVFNDQNNHSGNSLGIALSGKDLQEEIRNIIRSNNISKEKVDLNYVGTNSDSKNLSSQISNQVTSEVAQQLLQSTVKILTSNRSFLCSGVVINYNGHNYIATGINLQNYHWQDLLIEKRNGELHTCSNILYEDKFCLTFLPLNDENAFQGLTLSEEKLQVTQDIVAATSLYLPNSSNETILIPGNIADDNIRPMNHFQRYFSVDCQSVGSSGFISNVNGDCLGIISPSIQTSDGFTYALPSEIIKASLMQLTALGHYSPPILGAIAETLPFTEKEHFKIPELLNLSINENIPGVLVKDVIKQINEQNTSAQNAGLESNDIILYFNNKPVYTQEDLFHLINCAPTDEPLKIKILRDSKIIELTVSFSQPRQPLNQSISKSDAPQVPPVKIVKTSATTCPNWLEIGKEVKKSAVRILYSNSRSNSGFLYKFQGNIYVVSNFETAMNNSISFKTDDGIVLNATLINSSEKDNLSVFRIETTSSCPELIPANINPIKAPQITNDYLCVQAPFFDENIHCMVKNCSTRVSGSHSTFSEYLDMC